MANFDCQLYWTWDQLKDTSPGRGLRDFLEEFTEGERASPRESGTFQCDPDMRKYQEKVFLFVGLSSTPAVKSINLVASAVDAGGILC